MRLSTNQMFNSSVAGYQKGYADLAKTQAQINTGNRIQTPADDPVGSARLLQLEQQSALLGQYKSNMIDATNSLTQEEGVLQGMIKISQRARELAGLAGNGGYSDHDRAAIASELEQIEAQLFSLMNSKDASGGYWFSGSQSGIQPYVRNADGSYRYQGDESPRNLQVATGMQISVADSGYAAFESAKNVNRTATASAAASTFDGKQHLYLSQGAVSNQRDFDAEFREGDLPYELSIAADPSSGSGVGYVITDQGGNTLAFGPYDPQMENPKISFRGVEFTLDPVRLEPVYTLNVPAPVPGAGDLDIAGTAVALDGTEDLDAMVAKINAQTDKHGVRAQNDGGNLVLKSASPFTVDEGDTGTGIQGAARDGDATEMLIGHRFSIDMAPDNFSVAAATGNSAQISQVTIADAPQYAVGFPSAGVTLKYTDADGYQVFAQPSQPGDAPIHTQPALDADDSITVAGVKIILMAAAVDGDQFKITVDSPETQNILTTIARLRQALEQPADGIENGGLRIREAVASALGNIDSGMVQIESTQAYIGARLNSIDTLKAENESLTLMNTATQASIRETDQFEAASRLMLQQTKLEAAMAAFVRVSQLSLFDRL